MRKLLFLPVILSIILIGVHFKSDRKYFDIVVVGSEPEGMMAAIAAKEEGRKVAIVSDKVLGGTFFKSDLNYLDMNWKPIGILLTKGLFEEFYKDMGMSTAFDTKEAERWFAKKMQGIPVYHVDQYRVDVKKGKINRVNDVGGSFFIDASTNGDLMYLSGATCFDGQVDQGKTRFMAATLVFRVAGLDWQEIRNHCAGQPKEGSDDTAAWGYWDIAQRYKPTDDGLYLRGLNIGRERDGTANINGLQIYDVNPFQPDSINHSYLKAVKEVPRILNYLKKQAPGFARARLVGVAEELYIRESRHLFSQYQVTLEHVVNNEKPFDAVAYGSYPVDVQNSDIPYQVLGKPTDYGIPLRSLLPKRGPENLLVIGKIAGYDSSAFGSARVIPVGIVEGEAAVLVIDYVLDKGLSLKTATTKEHFKEIRERMKQRKLYVH